jgi:hypothetical protein
MKEMFRKSMVTSVPTIRMPGSEKFFIEKFVALIPGVTDQPFMKHALLSAQYHINQWQNTIARDLLRDTMRVLPVVKNMNSLDKSVEQTLKKYVDFFVANLHPDSINQWSLLRSLNMDSWLDVGSSRIAKPFYPPFDPNANKNTYPIDTLNYSIRSLYKTLENRWQPRSYFWSSDVKKESEDMDTKIRTLRPDLVPIQDPTPYTNIIPLHKDSPTVWDINQYTADQLDAMARMKRQSEDDEEDSNYNNYSIAS